MVYSKRKEFAPNGSKFFHFRVDTLSEGRLNNLESYLPWQCIKSLNTCEWDNDKRMFWQTTLIEFRNMRWSGNDFSYCVHWDKIWQISQ